MALVPLLSANIVSTVLESLLYGAYVLLALLALYLRVTSHHSERLTNTPGVSRWKALSPVVLGALLLFVVITSHWTLNVARLFLAVKEDGPGPQIFYGNLSHSTEVIKYGLLVASLFIGDWFLIHRLWVVWTFRTRIIIFPIVALMGFTAFGAGLTYQLTRYNSDDSIFHATFRRWVTGVCFFGLCTTAYTTGFSLYKLWSTSRVLKALGITSLTAIIRIFIDSAALLCVWGVFHVISYQCGSDLQFIAVDCMPAVVGISNLLIQIRLHWDRTRGRQDSGHLKSTQQIQFATDLKGRDPDPELDV
ncbi:hypothetical protein DFH09DRAFT_91467 [Mycena vulgaris]|nr:hypothetical protein DFH09DRAFT_91467 [Mycena vulgaris]